MSVRAVIDVSDLPHAAVDHRSPIWWGNILLLVVETTMFGLLAACYFYFLQNFTEFPPPKAHDAPVVFHPVPKLDLSSVNLIILLFSCIPMFWADRLCLRKDKNKNERSVQIALIISVLFGLLIAGLRFAEFFSFQFKWNENAYASTAWTIAGMHLLHLLTGTGENLLMLSWVLLKPLDDKHARDIRVTAIYWYWIAGIWIPLYIILFWVPRWI